MTDAKKKLCEYSERELLDGQFNVANLALELAGLTRSDTCSDDWSRHIASAS